MHVTKFIEDSYYYPPDLKNKLDDDKFFIPPYQRKFIWKVTQQKLFIDSLFKKYPIPLIYLRQKENTFEILDGQQRIMTIIKFMNNKLPVKFDGKDVFYDDLSSEQDEVFRNQKLSAKIFINYNDEEISEVFYRLQMGTSLHPGEVIHSMACNKMRNFIHNVLYGEYNDNNEKIKQGNVFFANIKRPNSRYQLELLMARLLKLEEAGVPITLYVQSIYDMLRKKSNYHTFSEHNAIAKNCLRNINYMNRLLDQVYKFIDKDHFVITFYLFVKYLRENYCLDEDIEKIKNFFYAFFEKFNCPDFKGPEILEWKGKTQNDENAIKRRDELLKQLFFTQIQNLNPLDKRRNFTDEERKYIYIRDKGICQKCRKKVDWDSYHADHKLCYHKGGKTTIANGQVMCSKCNLRKGAK